VNEHIDTQPNRVRALGGFTVIVNGTPIQRWKAGRARQLFQLLLANRGHPVPRHALIEAIWGDSTARCPEVSLKVAVCTLRRILAEAHQQGGGAADEPAGIRIESHPASYSLQTSDTFIDVDEFERLTNAGMVQEAAGRLDEACEQYRQAVQLYAGPYLPECHESWATVRRERLQDSLLHALDQLAAQSEHSGDDIAVLDLHQRMLDIDPCREDSYRALMRYHAVARQPSRVEHWYHTCVEQLQSRLGLEPDRETRRVFYEAVSGAAVAA
jgi:DNA-binding SARP family transcriptional activator